MWRYPISAGWMDGRSGEERDGYWQIGELALFRWKYLDRRVIGQHLLGWLVKLFFLPLMFVYFAGKVRYFQNYHFELVFTNFKFFYDFAFECLLYIDLLIACVGYLCTLKVTDSHIRSTDPTLLGWGVAIMCYQPFWAFFSAQYLDYQSGLWYPLFQSDTQGSFSPTGPTATVSTRPMSARVSHGG